MFCLVATERRDARPGGRAAGPEAEPQQDTSSEVVQVRAPSALEQLGRTSSARGPGSRNRFDSVRPDR